MDENLDQSQETQELQKPAESPQVSPPLVKKSDKTTNTIIIILLLLIFVVLGVLVGYQMIFKKTATDTGTEKTTTTETTTGSETTTQDQTGTIQSTTANIDADLNSLDGLDLSTIENDYGEDSLGDL